MADMTVAQALQVAFDALSKCVIVDPPEWWTDPPIPEDMTREQYEREQIASAQSEAAWAANIKEFSCKK